MAGTLNELVDWTPAEEQCDVQKFVEKYGRHVPLLIRIADGYAGSDEAMHSFALNEVSHAVTVFSELTSLYSVSFFCCFVSQFYRLYLFI